jgi:site-specific DNA recombinase
VGRRRSRERQATRPEDLRGLRTRTYVRESTERQADADHFGPDLQRAGIQEYCARNGLLPPEHEYFDAASGRKLEGRDSLQRAIDDALRGEYDVLLVFHSSRSFRNSHDAKVVKRKLREAGVAIVFTSQNLVSGDPHRKVEEGISELMDELRSDEQALFVASGLRQKFERGLHNGTVPLGYCRVSGRAGDPANGELRIVEDEAETVRKIFNPYAGGRLSELEIALKLNSEVDGDGRSTRRTKRGGPFTEGGIGEILGNRVYRGLVIWHPYTDEEQVREGRHQAIVDQPLFEKVQEVRASRVHWRGRRPVARAYPLSRRAVCYRCGQSVVGDTGGQKNRRRMRHARTGECSGWRSHSAHLLEDQMREVIAARMALPEDWQRLVLAALARPDEQASHIDQERAALEQARQRLSKQYTWGHISEDV